MAANQLTGSCFLLPQTTLTLTLTTCSPAPGEIPAQLGLCLGRLRILKLGHNRLTGQLPGELERLNRLQILDAPDNVLVGKLPDLSGFTHLREVNLRKNALLGTLPKFSQALEVVILDRNQLEGGIDALWPLRQLRVAHLSYNKLRGSL